MRKPEFHENPLKQEKESTILPKGVHKYSIVEKRRELYK
jgi:hypothetical protein